MMDVMDKTPTPLTPAEEVRALAEGTTGAGRVVLLVMLVMTTLKYNLPDAVDYVVDATQRELVRDGYDVPRHLSLALMAPSTGEN